VKRKYFISAFIIILLLGTWLGRKYNFFGASPNAKENVFRHTDHLILTKHVKCRMDCRHITEEEIKEIIHNGNVNYSRSGRGNKGDTTYALEGYSNEHQHLRVVVAPENDGLVVITCIDLDNEWPCNCY
jgi:Domain of unknown function (DUF4258)